MSNPEFFKMKGYANKKLTEERDRLQNRIEELGSREVSDGNVGFVLHSYPEKDTRKT